MKWNKL